MDIQQVRRFLADRIVWFGQSSILINSAAGKRIYIDPFSLPAEPLPADYVFLTHPHGDHYSPKDLKKILRPGTRVAAPKGLAAIATDTLSVGQEASIDGITVKTFAAYNRRGFPHSRSKGWLGYLISVDGVRIYHGGDTDSGAELEGMKPDLAFLPIAGFVSFNAKREPKPPAPSARASPSPSTTAFCPSPGRTERNSSTHTRENQPYWKRRP